MVLTFSVILFGALLVLRSLQKNVFYILHSCTMVLLAYWVETHYFRTSVFTFKTLLLFLAVHFIFINIFTFCAYWKDKRAAINGQWRIPEKDLHMLELLGGWTGALLGQKILHHKNRKKSYQFVFWLVPIFQILFVIIALQYLGVFHI